VVVGKRLDLRRKRQAEADPGPFGLLVTPTAHDSLWRGSSLTGVMTGPVPGEATREAVLCIALHEGWRVEIEDRLVFDATAALPRVA
jgi:hypothetical protein